MLPTTDSFGHFPFPAKLLCTVEFTLVLTDVRDDDEQNISDYFSLLLNVALQHGLFVWLLVHCKLWLRKHLHI